MNEQDILNIRYQAALTEQHAADVLLAAARDKAHWAVTLGLVPFVDGDQWCVLYGENIQVGVCAFGATPRDAIRQFDVEMLNARAGTHG
jgi:hypothetical protein